MRLHAALLALPATLLASLVLAVPSPAAYLEHQQPLSASTNPQRSRWRTLSDRVIVSIWGSSSHGKYVGDRASRTDRLAPSHTLARYGGDMVLRFNVSTAEEAKGLAEAADTLLLDVWEFSRDWVDIRLSKDIVAPLLGLLPQSLQRSHTPLLRERDLAQAIYDTYPAPRSIAPQTTPNPPSHLRDRPFSAALQQGDGESNLFFANYQPLSVLEPWLRLLASLFTTHVQPVTIGVSAQGRDISGLRVGVHPTNADKPKPSKRKTILITGGLHAREWISTSTVNYIAYNLITSYGKIPSVTRLLEAFDFVFIPTLNPDGYVYTWTTDRLWRKNRQQTTLRFCQGIDLDRAFSFQWDGDVTTDGNPCSESFAGESPFEAVEAGVLADWAKNETESNNVEFVGFLDLHSYSQVIQYPYSYSCDDVPPGLENLEELAMGLSKAIRVAHGHSYEVMPACEGNTAASSTKNVGVTNRQRGIWPRMEAAGGSAPDWFYREMRVRYAYQIKMRDRGTYGFLLPREEIVPTGKEILDAVLYLGDFLSEAYGVDGVGAVEMSRDGEETDGGEDDGEQVESFAGKPAHDDLEDDWVVADEEAEMLRVEDVQWELRRPRRR
ncbi:putative metallocarboxypeptidase ecm14 [Friedmanniomyces endolithicus]|nr:putative metallocarboxypeptidase ecm14 [Friedmanniomyces endolithicus]